MADTRIVDLTLDNHLEHSLFCIRNPKYPGYQAKLKWLEKRFKEGLKIKMVVPKSGGNPVGFIEYIPGEYNWRAVDAPGYFVIHCIMVYPKTAHGKGHGTRLVKACIEDAKRSGAKGVAVVTSDGPWIADRRLFDKLGFEEVDQSDRFELMVKKLKRAPLPRFRNWEAKLAKTRGWQFHYSHQCPLHAKAITELPAFAEKHGVKLKTRELRTAGDAQGGTCVFGVFGLVHDGRLLADHYISQARFRNILKKESSRP